MIYQILMPHQWNPKLPSCETEVTLTCYARPRNGAPADNGERWGVLILPGGGYEVHGDKEGEPVALSFLSHGCQAFVLNYPLAPDRHPLPLLYVASAISYLRDHAEEYGISRIAVCGFSAGGHLAGSMANLWNLPLLSETLGVDSAQFRPDAAILSYPVITYTPGNMSFDNLLGHPATDEEISLLSLEKSVSDQNPPTFLWATVTDEMVPVQNTLCYANALLEQGVSLELHLFPKGPHAMSTATRESAYARRRYDDPHVAMWTELCAQWLTGL